jgi:hypothetical protein
VLKQVEKLNERDLEPRFQGLLRGIIARVPFLKLESLKSDPVIRPQVAAKLVNAAVARPDWLLSVKAGARPWTWVAEGKRLGQPREVRAGVLQLKHYLSLLPPRTSSYGVLLAPYISEESARICTEAGMGYADLAGNARISFDQVFIETHAAENPFHEKRTVKSVFSPKATRVLRVLLRGPLRSWKVKELALEADVSLGHVSAVRQQLLAYEWAVENADGLLVSKPDGLFNAWIAADDWDARTTAREYALLVSDPVEIATKAHAFLSESAIPHAFTQWIAAHFRHPHTTPPVTTVYVSEFPPDDEIKDRLLARRVDAGGRLRLVRPKDVGVLSQIQTTKRLPLVSDVQIYLDLIKAGQRGDDAAAELRRWPDFSGGWA